MTPRRRALLILAAALVLGLIVAAPALAAAGGGSAGFGGGGGGGGGRGAGVYILFQLLIRLAIFGHGLGILIILGVIVAWFVFSNVAPKAQGAWAAQRQGGRRHSRRTAQRTRKVELAAAEAAEDDPAFAPDQVRKSAKHLYTSIQAAWSANDHRRLQGLVGPRLLREWERRLDDLQRRGWSNHVEPIGEPKVEYVGLTRADARDGEGRVVVRIEATLRDYVVDRWGNHLTRAGRLSETVKTREFWTLGRTSTTLGWQLLSIEQGAEGAHALEDKIVATPWSDDQGLRDEALVEQAAADAVPQGHHLAELADLSYAGDGRAAANDLSLIDGRFAPDIIEVAARRAVAAWADAIDGDGRALRELADPQAIHDLLYPGDITGTTRLVVRGPSIKAIEISGLNAAGTPPTMVVEVTITGRRYIENRSTTAVVAGDPARTTTFRERWTLGLSGDDAQPWRIVAVESPLPTRR